METFPSVIQSVTTDGKCLSVVTDWITDRKVSEFKKKRVANVEVLEGLFLPTDAPTDSKRQPVQWRDRFAIYNVDGITEGFEMLDPYGDVLIFPSESSTAFLSVKPTEKVNICPLCRPSPPLFLLLLPNPNSPHLQTTSPPSRPNTNLSHLSTTSYISWSFVVTAFVFWFTDGFYQFL